MSRPVSSSSGMVRISNYFGRSCLTVPPQHVGAYPRPTIEALRMAVPDIADGTLACFSTKLHRGAPVRMVFFGSSVTAGIVCKKRERSVNFPQQLAQFLEDRLGPTVNLTMDVYGYPGASPHFMRACHSSLMQTDAADLYVIEITDNLSDGYASVALSIEGLMGAVRQRAPNAALLLLAPFQQRCVRAIKRLKPFQHIPKNAASTMHVLDTHCYSNDSVAASLEDVGSAHNVTFVSARHLVARERLNNPSLAHKIIGQLHYDAVHPNGMGHWQLAAALEYAILRNLPPMAPASLEAAHGASARHHSMAPASPPKCIAPTRGTLELANRFASRKVSTEGMVCALGQELREHVLRASAWTYTVEHNKEGLPKPGYVAIEPGATLDLCHRPEIELPRHASTEGSLHQTINVTWSFGYLMSHEHMGQVRSECLSRESSCSCGQHIFDAHWKLPVSQPRLSRLRLQIKVSACSHLKMPKPPAPPERTLQLTALGCEIPRTDECLTRARACLPSAVHQVKEWRLVGSRSGSGQPAGRRQYVPVRDPFHAAERDKKQ